MRIIEEMRAAMDFRPLPAEGVVDTACVSGEYELA